MKIKGMDEMSAYLNLVEGTKQLAEERAERVANIQNEREKAEREMKEQQQAQAQADSETDAPEESQEELQQQLEALQKAIADVTSKIKGDAK